jgi:hypothetical protein
MSIGEVDSLQKDADNQVGVGLVKGLLKSNLQELKI